MSEYTEQQLTEWAAEADEQRYTLFLGLVSKHKSIWTLADEQGCLMIAEQDDHFLPVWPLECYAQAAAVEEWQQMKPYEVTLDDWFNKWVPGMTDDGFEVAVFPNSEGESTVLSPEELAVEIKLQRKKAPIV